MSQQDIQAARKNSYRASVPTQRDTGDDDADNAIYPTRLPTSARRYRNPQTQQPRKRVVNVYDLPSAIPPRRSRTAQDDVAPAQPQGRPAQHRSRIHWLLFVGVGMIAMLALWVLGTILMNWWKVAQDDWHYGRPRTFQCDAVVGHNDSPTNPSHFVALNLNRHVEVIEFPGGDATHAKIYIGPTLFGDGQDVTPVTLSFKDVNGDGKPDMLVHVQDQTIVFLNDNGTFRPQKPGEYVTL